MKQNRHSRSGFATGVAASLLLAAAGAQAQSADTLRVPSSERLQRGPEATLDPSVTQQKTLDQRIAELNRKILADPTNGDLYNDLGVLYTEQEAWGLARDAFIRAVQAKPHDPDFHRNLGLAFARLEDWDLAARSFETYIELGQAGQRDGWRLQASALRKAGDTAGARDAYAAGLQALGKQPLAEVMRLALGLASLERDAGNEEAVRRVLETYQPISREFRETAEKQAGQPQTVDGYEEAEAIENNLLALYLDNGQILEDSGLMLEAAHTYEKAYELAPDRAELLPRIVDAYLKAGEPLKAKVTANLARQAHPDKPGTWIATGKIYEQTNQLDEAIDAYEKAYELDPGTPDLAVALGNLLMKAGRVEEGRRYLAAEINDPDTPTEVVYNYAVSLIRADKYRAAVPPLRRVVRERPDFAPGWAALAQTLRALKDYAGAIEPYRRALELSPDPRLAYNLGISAMRAERWDTAVAAYDTALAMDPTLVEARYNKALTLMRAGRLDEAVAAFDAVLEVEPDSYRVYLNKGVTLYKMGQYAEAVDAYSRALEIDETAEAYDNMGLAYQELGDKKNAQACYAEAKKLRGGR